MNYDFGVHGFKIYEVVKYCTEVSFSGVVACYPMNQKKYDSLPGDVRQPLDDISGVLGSQEIAMGVDNGTVRAHQFRRVDLL